jgi:hypothetical protein
MLGFVQCVIILAAPLLAASELPAKEVGPAKARPNAGKVEAAQRQLDQTIRDLADARIALERHVPVIGRLRKVYLSDRVSGQTRSWDIADGGQFGDSTIAIVWVIEKGRIAFALSNQTAAVIAVRWDQASIVSGSGDSHRVTHEGVRFIEAHAAVPDSAVVPGARLTDVIIPSDSIEWLNSQWTVRPFPRTEDAGSRIKVLLPIVTHGSVSDYVFTFAIVPDPAALAIALKVDLIMYGMGHEDVRAILGTPTEVTTGHENGQEFEEWSYRFPWCVVRFSATGKTVIAVDK